MKKSLLVLCLSSALVLPAFADEDYKHRHKKSPVAPAMYEHQKGMHQHMEMMHNMMEKMQSMKPNAKRKKIMQEHLQSMEKGVQMMKDMMAARRAANEDCMRAGEQDPDGPTCFEAVSHEDARMNMMLLMMEQMVQRHKMMDE